MRIWPHFVSRINNAYPKRETLEKGNVINNQLLHDSNKMAFDRCIEAYGKSLECWDLLCRCPFIHGKDAWFYRIDIKCGLDCKSDICLLSLYINLLSKEPGLEELINRGTN